MEELDFNVGRLVDFLKKEGLFENTVIVFTSDNGPWLNTKKASGSALPLRNGKYTVFEGGMRMPCIISYPAKIKKSLDTFEIMSSIDLLPTFAKMAGAEVPPDIDGVDLSDFIEGRTDKSPRDEFAYYHTNGKLHGIRKGNYKLLFMEEINPVSLEFEDPKYKNYKKGNFPLELYDLSKDISEKNNLAEQMPEKVAELLALSRKYKDSERK